MNNKIAKALRRMVYQDRSPKAWAREYYRLSNGVIIGDQERRNYKEAKKFYKSLSRPQRAAFNNPKGGIW